MLEAIGVSCLVRDIVCELPGENRTAVRASTEGVARSLAAAPIEITWPGGVLVRVSPGCDLQLLRQTLQVLRSLDGEAQPC
jgi:hypothetical protein